ncbi:radial spoke head protein 3 homolog B-like [Bacillus rossius redtenbacheri]|uniref:radial spoke head protein 3 homolog B-like n=1 Tax=Bacillus rossius redtenbacheri TaxID=93214 RepID=UPI002FDDF35C
MNGDVNKQNHYELRTVVSLQQAQKAEQGQQNSEQRSKVNKYHKNCHETSGNYFNTFLSNLRSRVASKGDFLNGYKKSKASMGSDQTLNTRGAKGGSSVIGGSLDKLERAQESPKRPNFVTTVRGGQFLEPPRRAAPPSASVGDSPASSTNDSSLSVASSQRDQQLYSFCSAPRALHHQPRHPRSQGEENGTINYGNLMYDRRIVRGSTFAQHASGPKWNPYFGYAKLLSKTDADSQTVRQQEARRRALARRRVQECRLRQGTPPPVPGRRHEKVQTEKFLEDLAEHPPDSEAGVQADLLLHTSPPASLPEIPTAEAETQIYPGELFDFESELETAVLSLVSKTIEESLTEVLHEEELEIMRTHQRQYKHRQANTDATVAEMDNHEDPSPPHYDSDKEAIVLPTSHLEEMIEEILESMKEAGYRLNDIDTEGNENVLKWLMKEVKQELKHTVTSKDVLADIVHDIVETRGEVYRVMLDDEADKLDLGSDDDSKETKKEEGENAS